MKKLVLSAIVFGVLCLAVLKTVQAQSLTFDRAYQDYQFNLTIYDTAYSDYQNAKTAYLDNPTLALKETARQKTYTMLVDRDQLMVVYLTALRARIAELPGLSPEDKGNIFSKIDPDVNFYVNHKGSFHSDDSLDQLFATASESQSQYKKTTSLIVEESLFDISLGQVEGLRIEHEQIFTGLKSMIDAGVASGKLTLDPFNRWLTDIDTTDKMLKENESTAKTQIAQIYASAYSFQGGYDAAINTLSTSIKPLTQFNEFLTEVANYIKSHE